MTTKKTEASMKLVRATLFAALLLSTPAAILAQTSSLSSASKLTPDGKGDSWTYRNPSASLSSYQSFIIQPTAVYTDPTAQWGGTTPEQRQKYAAYMTKALRDEVGTGYQIVDRPGPGVATLRLTLLGVQKTIGGVATAARATPMGFAFHGIQSLRGKKGSMTGSAQVALEVTDSRNGALVFAAVRKRSPNALDIESTLSTEKTVEAVADDIAKAVRKGIDTANGR
jgi:Protein of unknown function (DUF3313)